MVMQRGSLSGWPPSRGTDDRDGPLDTEDLVGTGGIEPPTPSASRKCSPAELRAFVFRIFNGEFKRNEE